MRKSQLTLTFSVYVGLEWTQSPPTAMEKKPHLQHPVVQEDSSVVFRELWILSSLARARAKQRHVFKRSDGRTKGGALQPSIE